MGNRSHVRWVPLVLLFLFILYKLCIYEKFHFVFSHLCYRWHQHCSVMLDNLTTIIKIKFGLHCWIQWQGIPVQVFRPFTVRDDWEVSIPDEKCQTSRNRTHKRNYLCETYLSGLISISFQFFNSFEREIVIWRTLTQIKTVYR